MTDLEKLEIACTANDGRFRDISINRAYMWAGLVEYVVMFWSKANLAINGMVSEKDYKSAKKAASKIKKKGYFGAIHAYQKNTSDLLRYNLWTF